METQNHLQGIDKDHAQVRVFARTFNKHINSKTGYPLPKGQIRGTPEWEEFEEILFKEISSLGHEVLRQPEHPKTPDDPAGATFRIYVHKTKRDTSFGNLFYMQMHLRDLFTLDTNGWGCDHSSYPFGDSFVSEGEDALEMVQKLSDDMLSTGISKIEQPTEPIVSTPRRFILVPLQIPRDYTLLWHSPITVRYFIDSLQNWANESQEHIAFKLHPCNKIDTDLINVVDEAAAESRYIHKVEGNIHELIKRSSGLFVINSGTGFEGLVHGKPVATFGYCDYSKVTFNADIRRVSEARDFIYSYTSERRMLGYRFVYWYLHRHAYYLKDPNMRSRLRSYLEKKL